MGIFQNFPKITRSLSASIRYRNNSIWRREISYAKIDGGSSWETRDTNRDTELLAIMTHEDPSTFLNVFLEDFLDLPAFLEDVLDLTAFLDVDANFASVLACEPIEVKFSVVVAR